MPTDRDETQKLAKDTYTPVSSTSDTLERRPTNLSEQVNAWLKAVTTLAKSYGVQGILAELQDLDARQKLPGFRLAFVGEFSRGKSTLINRLLDRAILPVGQVPTTTTITSIVASPEESMIVQFSDESQETRPLEQASWNGLVSDGEIDRMQTDFPRVQLTLKHLWLYALGAEILDTPGVVGIKDQRTSLISELLSQCDAAVLVVSAESPFSLTETAFLEQEVLGRHVPRIMVVVSKLDRIFEDQQELLTTIQKRVARISPLIPVISAHTLSPNISDEQTLEMVRTQIQQLAIQADRHAWRSQQAAFTLVDLLGKLIEFGNTAIASAQASTAKREEMLRMARNEARKTDAQWQQITLDLDKRRLQVAQELRQRLLEAKSVLIESAAIDLAKTANIQVWWEREYPFRLRREFLGIVRNAESFVIDSLNRDVKWLQDEVARVLAIRVEVATPEIDQSITVTPNIRELVLPDLDRKRLFLKLGAGTAAILGELFLGPLGFAVGKASEVVGFGGAVFANSATNAVTDRMLSREVEQQRQLVEAEVARSIDLSIEEYTSRMSARLSALYCRIAGDMRCEQSSWQETRQSAIVTSESTFHERDWQQLIVGATTLRNTILTALNG